MAVASRLAVLVLAALVSQGCAPVCDEAALRRVAAAVAGDQRAAGLDALADACPTLPPALLQGLVAGESTIEAAKDPAWQALLTRTCPAATHAKGAAEVHEELDGTRELCELDRHGLLAADAVFARGDLFVFALLEWLLAGRVERSLATAVAQPLLTAERFAAVGLTPPRGRTDVPLREFVVEVRVTPTALAVDGAELLRLERGRPASGAVVGHVLTQLRDTLAARADRAKQKAEETGVPWGGSVTLLLDRGVPFATLADVMFTAMVAEYSDFQLVVHDGRELRGLPIAPTREWSPQPLEDILYRRDLDLTFIVGLDAVVARAGKEPSEGRRFELPAGAAISEYVAKVKDLFPNEVVATFRVDPEVTMQALVSLIDTVAGSGCRLAGALRGEKIPDACMFWQPVLDREPPFIGWPRPGESP